MKIRLGFVSNSSSSSFIAVGFYPDAKDFAKIVKHLNLDFKNDDYSFEDHFNERDNGIFESKKLPGLCLYCYGEEKPFFIGVNAEPLIAQDLRLSDIKTIMYDLLDRHSIKINKNDINFHYGEAGGG